MERAMRTTLVSVTLGLPVQAIMLAVALAACSGDSAGDLVPGGGTTDAGQTDTGRADAGGVDAGGTDTGGGTDAGGTDTGGGTTPERPTRRPSDTPPPSESTPPTPASERRDGAEARPSRDSNPDRGTPPPVAPDGLDEEMVALGAEYIEYCWDSCDIAWTCFDLSVADFAACYEDCVDDLERIYTGITTDDAGADCLDGIVEAIYCETSFADDALTIDDVCDDYEDLVTAQSAACEGEYLDVEFYCDGFDDTLVWFFEDDLIGNVDVGFDFEVNEALDFVLEACLVECTVLFSECYEDDGTSLNDCEADCVSESASLSDALDGSAEALDCAESLEFYGVCRADLGCEEHYTEEDTGTDLCDPEWGDVLVDCSGFFDF